MWAIARNAFAGRLFRRRHPHGLAAQNDATNMHCELEWTWRQEHFQNNLSCRPPGFRLVSKCPCVRQAPHSLRLQPVMRLHRNDCTWPTADSFSVGSRAVGAEGEAEGDLLGSGRPGVPKKAESDFLFRCYRNPGLKSRPDRSRSPRYRRGDRALAGRTGTHVDLFDN
jgi:hypothetical protein